jgi:serine/threonine-protein kinase HipA
MFTKYASGGLPRKNVEAVFTSHNKAMAFTAKVFYNEIIAGTLEKRNEGYLFIYDKGFLNYATPISMSLPVREEPYYSKELFPFFKGLLPEGWYLDIVSTTQKVDAKDYFGLLVSTSGMDTIGAVTVRNGEMT